MNNNKIPEISRVMGFEDGETVQIFGENIEEKSVMYWWRSQRGEDRQLEDCGMPNSAELPIAPPQDAKKFKVSTVVNGRIAYLYADSEVPAGTAIIWVQNSAGISKPFVVNRPEIWNQSYRKTYGGAVVSFYGDGFYSINYKHACMKDISTGEFIKVDVFAHKSAMYTHDEFRHRVEIKVPEALKDGEYEVYLHSGTGGVYGWSEPVKLIIENNYSLTEYYRTKWSRDVSDRLPFPKCEVKVIAANPLGALYDSTDEIQSAIDSLESTGGIVMLTAGTYGVSRTLTLKPGVVLQGAGKCATTIRVAQGTYFKQDWNDCYFAARPSGGKHWAIDWQPHWAKLNQAAFVRIYEDAGVEEIRFELGDGANMGILVSGNTPEAVVNGAFANYVTVDGAALSGYHGKGFGTLSTGLISVSNNNELTVFNCNFSAIQPIGLLPAYNFGIRIIKNELRCSPRQLDEVYLCGLKNSIISENDFIDGRRTLMMQEGLENTWIYQNRSIGVSRGCNANEVYMSEYGNSDWAGKATFIGEDYIIADLNDYEKDFVSDYDQNRGDLSKEALREYRRFLVIIDGRGLGQYREVISVDNDKITLAKPFEVMPDENTAFTLVSATWRNIWIDNNAEFCNSHSQFIWNCGIENIITGHEMRISGGIRLFSLCHGQKAANTCVVAFNKVVHCQVVGSGKGIWLDSSGQQIEKDPNCNKPDYVKATGGGMFGNSIRQCVFEGMKATHYVKNLPYFMDYNPHCGMAIGGAYNTICNNRIGSYRVAVELLDNCQGNCFDNNVYTDNNIRMRGKGTPIGSDIERYQIKL